MLSSELNKCVEIAIGEIYRWLSSIVWTRLYRELFLIYTTKNISMRYWLEIIMLAYRLDGCHRLAFWAPTIISHLDIEANHRLLFLRKQSSIQYTKLNNEVCHHQIHRRIHCCYNQLRRGRKRHHLHIPFTQQHSWISSSFWRCITNCKHIVLYRCLHRRRRSSQ